MTPMISYELYAYRDGRWMIDSMYDDRELALYESRRLTSDPFGHILAVKLVEERYDPAANASASRVIFRDRKGKEQSAPAFAKPGGDTSVAEPSEPAQRPQRGPLLYLVALVLAVGGIGVGVLVAMAYLRNLLG